MIAFMNNYLYTNPITFQVINDIETARSTWEYFSPQDEIDDDWNFRYAFYKYLKFPLHFIVGYHGKKPVGLLPLQWNTGKGPTPESYEFKKNFLEFFGGDDMDSNKVFIKPGYEDLIPAFLQQIHEPAVLAPLANPYMLPKLTPEPYTTKYVADLKGMTEFRDFTTKYFDGKGRGKLNNQLNKLHRSYEIKIVDADAEDLELLFEYNKERFGVSSSFQWEYRKQVFRDLMEQYDHDVFKVMINGEKKAVSFSLLYKNTYLSMNIGYDYGIRDLGKLVVSTQFERAIKLKCDMYDGGKGDSGWKEQFHLNRVQQFMLTIPANISSQAMYSR
jgi:hypothetical protein